MHMDKQRNGHEFDAIVVGSGPSGATIARELSKRKRRVLILERGGNEPIEEGSFRALSIFSPLSVGENLTMARAFTTGGSTVIYFAVSGLPPLATFRSLGIDLSKELDEVRAELPFTVLPDEVLGAQSIRLRQSAKELGYKWEKNPMLVDLSKCASGYTYESKWTARTYLQQAIENGAMLATRAKVVKVLVEKGQAIGVEYQLQKGKGEVELRKAFAARTILAAGASSSPIILRDSGMKSIANSGYYCGPSFALYGIVPGMKAGDSFIGTMGGEQGDGIGLGDANAARAPYRMFLFGNRKFARAFRHSKSIGIAVKIREGLGGVLQEDGRYFKQLKKEDFKKLEAGEEAGRRILRHAGAKDIIKTRVGAGQLGGTIRIKEHLDENLQTEYRNLHVCDGAIIPESVKVPPTLTLVCLGKFLANHLSQAI
jgi:hypothetical protein